MIADVVSVGARGPLGLSSLQVTLCARAHKLEPRSVRIRDRRGQEIGMALTGGLGEGLHGYPRLVALAAPALFEAVSSVPAELRPERALPLVLSVPERGRPDDDQRLTRGMLGELAERSGVRLDERSVTMRMGHAGFAHALQLAKEMLDEGKEMVCVGGVDSYYHPALLQWLDRERRLHAVGADDGFIPSEAAAFLVLSRLPQGARRLGRVLEVETSEELAAGGDDEPNVGLAMRLMIEALLARAGAFLWALSDDNGEPHRHAEWLEAQRRALPPGLVDTRIVWDTGDVGAASGALFATIALLSIDLGCASAPRVLVALHSDGKERGLVALAGAGDG